MGFFKPSFRCPRCGHTYSSAETMVNCPNCRNSRNNTTTYRGYGGKPKLTQYDARTSSFRPGHTKTCPTCRGRCYNAGGICTKCGGTGTVVF